MGCASEWLAHHSTSALGDTAVWIVFLSYTGYYHQMGSSTNSLMHRLNPNVNWSVIIFAVDANDVSCLCVERGHGCSSCSCCNAIVLCSKTCAKGGQSAFPLFQHFLSGNYCLTLEIPTWRWYTGDGGSDIGHLVIMTLSFCLYCLCIISSIRAEIIDSPFMLIVWIWSVDEQILSHVVFRVWHLKWNEESVRFQSDSRMFLFWPQWQPWVEAPGCTCTNQSRHWMGRRPSDVFHHCLFRELYYCVSTDGGKLDRTHACRALPINPPSNRAVRLQTQTHRDKTDPNSLAFLWCHRNIWQKVHKKNKKKRIRPLPHNYFRIP